VVLGVPIIRAGVLHEVLPHHRKAHIARRHHDQARPHNHHNGLPPDLLEELVHEPRERVRADLGPADRRGVARNAQLPLAAGRLHGGHAHVERAPVRGVVVDAGLDLVRGGRDGADLGLGDVGLDGAHDAEGHVDQEQREEDVERRLRVVREHLRQVGVLLDGAEEAREPAGRGAGGMGLARFGVGVRVAGDAAATCVLDQGVPLGAPPLADFLDDVVLGAAEVAAGAVGDGAEAVAAKNGLLVGLGDAEGGHGAGELEVRGVFCVAVVGGGGLCAGGFREEVGVEWFARGGEGGVAERRCGIC